MNRKSREKRHTPFGPRQTRERGRTEAGRDQRPKPQWPAGLLLPPSKDVACFIPRALAVVLSHQAFERLFGYAYSATSEICCLGTVKQVGERFRVERFYLVPQLGSLGHTELDEEAVAALVEELLAQDKGEEAHSVRCWAHYHTGMDVFWSKTDEETCKRLVTEYLISLVVGDGFAIRCRIDVGGPVRFTIDHMALVAEMTVSWWVLLPSSSCRFAGMRLVSCRS